MKNPVKAKLRKGETSIGTWVTIGHPDISEILANLGFDWLIFDMEHAPLSVEVIQSMMQSMHYAEKCIPLVRVPWNDPALIKRALDIGAYGIMVPWVNTKEDASNAVRYCKYPPEGIRGFGPRRAALHDPEYAKTANEELLIIIQVETEHALKNIDKILSVKGIDVCVIGTYDLSLSLGIREQFDHPKFKSAVERILEATKRWDVAPGIHCETWEINEAIERGFRFCSLSGDVELLTMAVTESIKKVKGWKH